MLYHQHMYFGHRHDAMIYQLEQFYMHIILCLCSEHTYYSCNCSLTFIALNVLVSLSKHLYTLPYDPLPISSPTSYRLLITLL
jgi:hypothetical protein